MPSTLPEDALIHIGRQAIFNVACKVQAYELLFRQGDEQRATFSDHEGATAHVLSGALMDVGLEVLTGGRPAYINVSRDFLLGECPGGLPHERLVLELLEDMQVDEPLLKKLRELSRAGFCLALDDYRDSPQNRPLLEVVDVVKLDVQALDRRELEAHVPLLRRFGVRLVAEKVESREDFAFCRKLGFELFQGYFLRNPQVIQGRRVPGSRLVLMELLARVNDPTRDIEDLEQLVGRDLSLSYRLIRYINSAGYTLSGHVESIRHALLLLGLRAARAWVNLVVLAGIEDKPREILVTAMIRARMCEHIAGAMSVPGPERCFTAGLFSLLDALMDCPMEELLEELPLAPEVLRALRSGEGPYGGILSNVVRYEENRWAATHGGIVPSKLLREAYLRALDWVAETHSGPQRPVEALRRR